MNLLEQQEINQLETEEIKESFSVDSLEKASWAFKKIAALNSRIKEKEELAALEKARIDDWLTSDTKSDKESILYFESLLTSYYVQLKEVDPKAKLSTPYGKVTSRKLQPKWEFDEERAIEYFRNNKLDELINVKESIDKTKAKKVFNIVQNNEQIKVVDENGEFIEFVKVTPQNDAIKVTAE